MSWKSRANAVLSGVAGVRLVRDDGSAEAGRQGPRQAQTKGASSARRRKLTRVTDEMVRAPVHPEVDRLLNKPIFVLSPVRSGSTLLRYVMGAHSRLHAPHEMHVRRLTVQFATRLAEKSMTVLGHNQADLEHLLWDRVMHRELALSGKEFFVDKTPSNAFVHHRIATAWPDARFVFLIRHPASIAASWAEASAGRRTGEEAVLDALRYMKAVQRAREDLTGLTVRYEHLTAEPEVETRRICEFLEVDWEPDMLKYGSDGGVFDKGLGDWTDKIQSGEIQRGRPLPDATQIPEPLHDISRAWGYLA